MVEDANDDFDADASDTNKDMMSPNNIITAKGTAARTSSASASISDSSAATESTSVSGSFSMEQRSSSNGTGADAMGDEKVNKKATSKPIQQWYRPNAVPYTATTDVTSQTARM